MKPNKNIDVSVVCSASRERWLLVDQAVQNSGKSLADFIFEAAWEKARTISKASSWSSNIIPQDQTSYVLEFDVFKKFLTELESQPKLNPAVRRLMQTSSCWEPKALTK